jgi:phage/plasmid-associated DNA primase
MSSNVRNPLLNYASNDEFYDALEEEFVKFQQEMSKKRLPMKFAMLAMLRRGNFARLVLDDNGSSIKFIPDYDTQEFSTDFKVMITHLVRVSSQYQFYYNVYEKDAEMMFAAELLDNTIVEELVLPPERLILCHNGVYDLEKRKYTDELRNQDGKRYFFSHRYNFDVKPLKELDAEKLKTIEAIHQKWSENNATKCEFIEMTLLGCLMGLDIKRQIVIEGSGGNGKSTFLNECKMLAGTSQYLDINLHDFDNDPIFSMIRPYHKLLAGDDLSVNWLMNATVSNRFKQLVMGTTQLINQKYKEPIPVVQRGMRIQLTNDFMRMMERGSVMEDRLLFLKWTGDNFREANETKEVKQMKSMIEDAFGTSLDALVDPLFKNDAQYSYYTHLVSWLLSRHKTLPVMQDFAKFAIAFKEELAAAIDAHKDSLDDFLDECELDGKFSQPRVFVSLLYQAYTQNLELTNPGAKPVRIQAFSKRVEERLIDLGYKRIARSKPKWAKFTDCNIREYVNGKAIDQLGQYDKYVSRINGLSITYENSNIIHCCAQLDEVQLITTINEMAAERGLTEIDIYSMNYTEFKEAYEEYVNQ